MAKKNGWVPWALGAVIVGQFFWWNEKCPQVLAGKKGYAGGSRRRGLRGRR